VKGGKGGEPAEQTAAQNAGALIRNRPSPGNDGPTHDADQHGTGDVDRKNPDREGIRVSRLNQLVERVPGDAAKCSADPDKKPSHPAIVALR